MSDHNPSVYTKYERLMGERNSLTTDNHTLRVEIVKLRAERDSLTADLARVTAERDEAQKRIRFLEEMGVECVNDWKRIEEQATRITAAEAERDRAREALDALMFEAKVYAAHNKLEPLAQRMYDIAEAALAPAQGDA